MNPLSTPEEIAREYPKPTDETDQRFMFHFIVGIIRHDRERIAQVVQGMIASRTGTWDENTAGRNMALADLLVLLRPGNTDVR